ncbi:MAG: sigma 54-interacting transcriptional regulator [Syntrophomonadaceae bacterium]|nr:sigma 54-interacting transcriptional regulator [Syntrophomonadaceae bacterium]
MSTWQMLEYLFDQIPYMATIMVDKEGKVIFINKTYLRILKLSKKEVIGKHIGTITPRSRTLVVLKTGRAEVGYNWIVNDQHLIATSLPVYENNEIIGSFAYSIFLNIYEAKNLVEDLLSELNMYKSQVNCLLRSKYDFDDIIGEDQRLKDLKFLAAQIAHHKNTTVLISGESGTGKELFAHAIHNSSCRSPFPFVRVNCAAIPENLLEAELFGYEKGAYTGANKEGKLGKFELANGGTIFLDEIGEMPLSMQSKLLVVLQEQIIERLGGVQPIKVDVRVIAATNRELSQMVQEGTFREDLFYRLNVFNINIPALRNHKRDIPILVNHFIDKLNSRLNTHISGISKDGLDYLCQYHWPGNIRELENVLERALILADMEKSRQLGRKHFNLSDYDRPELLSDGKPGESLKAMIEEYEKTALLKTLEKTDFDKKRTAAYLNIDLSSLYRKMRKHKILS